MNIRARIELSDSISLLVSKYRLKPSEVIVLLLKEMEIYKKVFDEVGDRLPEENGEG